MLQEIYNLHEQLRFRNQRAEESSSEKTLESKAMTKAERRAEQVSVAARTDDVLRPPRRQARSFRHLEKIPVSRHT